MRRIECMAGGGSSARGDLGRTGRRNPPMSWRVAPAHRTRVPGSTRSTTRRFSSRPEARLPRGRWAGAEPLADELERGLDRLDRDDQEVAGPQVAEGRLDRVALGRDLDQLLHP